MKNKPHISNKMNDEALLNINLKIKHKEVYAFVMHLNVSLSDKNVNKDRLMYNLLESGG